PALSRSFPNLTDMAVVLICDLFENPTLLCDTSAGAHEQVTRRLGILVILSVPMDPANEMEVDAGPIESPKPRLEFFGCQLRVGVLPLRRLTDLHNHRQIFLIGVEGGILEVVKIGHQDGASWCNHLVQDV